MSKLAVLSPIPNPQSLIPRDSGEGLTHTVVVRASYLDNCPNCSKGIIPGLDAVTCLGCKTVWIDQTETEKFYRRKREGINH